jgi:iron-sulfur cluster repair protein YtfE (RIC family)
MQNDIFKQLKKEHLEVTSLFEQCKKAAPAERKKLLMKIEAELVPHARAEEKTLYARLYESQSEASGELDRVNEAYEEHALVDKLLKELKGLSVDDEMWLAKLAVIKENVEHHVKEEEQELFDLAKDALDKEEQKEILDEYNEQKEIFEESLPSQKQISEKTPAV